jgi:hypothetical protein
VVAESLETGDKFGGVDLLNGVPQGLRRPQHIEVDAKVRAPKRPPNRFCHSGRHEFDMSRDKVAINGRR